MDRSFDCYKEKREIMDIVRNILPCNRIPTTTSIKLSLIGSATSCICLAKTIVYSHTQGINVLSILRERCVLDSYIRTQGFWQGGRHGDDLIPISVRKASGRGEGMEMTCISLILVSEPAT